MRMLSETIFKTKAASVLALAAFALRLFYKLVPIVGSRIGGVAVSVNNRYADVGGVRVKRKIRTGELFFVHRVYRGGMFTAEIAVDRCGGRALHVDDVIFV